MARKGKREKDKEAAFIKEVRVTSLAPRVERVGPPLILRGGGGGAGTAWEGRGQRRGRDWRGGAGLEVTWVAGRARAAASRAVHAGIDPVP